MSISRRSFDIQRQLDALSRRRWTTALLAPCTAAITLGVGTAASAAEEPGAVRQLGDHPAVVVQRLYRKAGYDYASKFYPHPAWLYLRPASSSQPSPSPSLAQPAQPAQTPQVSPAESARVTAEPHAGG